MKNLRIFSRAIQSLVEHEIRDLREITMLITDLLSQEAGKFHFRMDKLAQTLSKADQDELYDFYSDDYWQLSKLFPNITASSLFVTSYSLLEYNLLSLCKGFQQDYSIKLDDLKDEGIFLAQTYLKKVVGIDFPDTTKHWNEIHYFNSIRNFIVHNNGQLNNKKRAEALKTYIKTKKSLTLDSHNRIEISIAFISEELDTLEAFFKDVFLAIDKWIKNRMGTTV